MSADPPASVPLTPAGGSVLDLHEGLSDVGPSRHPDRRRGGCPRWPENTWLLSTTGERVPGRCKATNLCDYCARLAAVENTEMLSLDAMNGNAPEVWAVLTTRTVTLDMTLFYDARELVMRAIRRRWPDAEYACLLEFTTGYGPLSGGKRRPHWNLMLKGVPAAELDQARELIVRVWCDNVDAKPDGQHVGVIREAGGLMRYIALHFQKESQAPPEGFRGQRFNCSRGYFTGMTRAEAREEAKASLWEKRQLHRAAELGLEGDEAEDFVDRAYLMADGVEWRLYFDPPPKRPADRNARGDRVPAFMLEAAAALEEWRDELHQLLTDLEAGQPNPPGERMQLVPRGPS